LLEHRVGDRAADVVEVRIDAVGGGLGQGAQVVVGRFVVDPGVEPEFVLEELDFGVGAGEPDDPRAVEFRDLSGDGADRTGRPRDDERLARPRAGDFVDAEVRGVAGIPSTPRYVEIGARSGSTWVSSGPGAVA
jgi:hypothetical protein